ncbi:GerMN domain-containing protein [Allocoleopsis franciscana]|uniref:Sporulation/spore germination protein n=1 Tax=Allocoleopsis franciscana PCC 7113 TaxID=1173027 RepID=K9WDN4_9CYAN|nr:GerMN domain-containing protein [Allocoleopsis franciscana]AFZ17916.1 sporulation/spore germination protein [Allocoleopsis franciscana PCC 7113]
MQDQHNHNARRIPIGLIASVSAALVTAGAGATWWVWNSNQSSQTPPQTTTQAPTTSQPSNPTLPSPQPVQPTAEETVKIYWVNNVNNKIEVVPSSVTLKKTDKPSDILEGAFESLLAGPVNQAFSTTIPQGTKLKNVSLQADGVHVDLSEEFTEGGGSASMTGRVAQVIYTASSLDPAAKVWISVEGKPLEVLGGEGLMLDQPMTRQSFEQNFNL